MTERVGVILAGGYSTRFGDADKAVAELGGVPMIRRVADRVATVVDAVVVNCRAEQTPSLRDSLAGLSVPTQFAEDPDPDRGPLYGIRTGLTAAETVQADSSAAHEGADDDRENGSTGYAAVVACDMPFVAPDFLAYLFDRASGHDAAVPRLDDGWFQPTQAVYRTRATRAACDEALAADEGRIVAAIERLDHVVVTETEVRRHATLETFENVNTREELADAERRLG